MAGWKPVLDVEYNGATFLFQSPDDAYLAFAKHCQEEQSATVNPLAPKNTELLNRIFVEGCVGWEGVEGLEYSKDNMLRLPILDRASIAGLYVGEVMGIDAKKVLQSLQPTGSMPPGDKSGT